MKPTDLGIAGPTSLDMARAFRSIRADPLSFLIDGPRAVRRCGIVPRAGPARPAAQRPRRRATRAADLRPALGEADRAVRRARPGDRSGPAGVVRAELDRAPAPRRAGVPPPAAPGGRAPGGRGGRRGRLRPARPAGTASSWTSPPSPTASASTPSDGHCSPPTCRGTPSACWTPRATRRSWWCASAVGAADGAWAPTPTNLRLRATRRRLDAISADLIAQRRRRGAPRRRPPRPPPRQRAQRRRDPRRAGHHGDRGARDRGRGAGLDADAPGGGPARPGPGAGRARRARGSGVAARAPGDAALDTSGRRRVAAPLPARLGAVATLAPGRRDRGPRGTRGHPGHRQPVAGAPAQRPVARPAHVPARALPGRGRGRCRATCRSGRGPACASGGSSRSARWSSC